MLGATVSFQPICCGRTGARLLGGLVLSWLLIAGLGIIWLTFLLPSRRRSPSSSVEEFEQKMSMLAEANKASAGRWVLMPRKGERFMGSDRGTARARRRRRFVFIALLDLGALTLIIGLFPPFRPMLLGTVVIAAVLLVYTAFLVKVRADEADRMRARRRMQLAAERADARTPSYAGSGSHSSNGNGNGHADLAFFREGGVEIIDDDVHVIVRRSDEFDVSPLRKAAR
jgi:hypothetical protein